jgi:hypothetical protein
MLRNLAPAIAAALALGACGGGDTKTVTETRTVTVTVPAARTQGPSQSAPAGGGAAATSPDARRRARFCGSRAGDVLQQAGAEATSALNDRDLDAMLAAQAKAFGAARRAPEGAHCAVAALNSLRFSWNNGAQNFKGHDYRAEAEKIRRFQEQRKLVGALPGQ